MEIVRGVQDPEAGGCADLFRRRRALAASSSDSVQLELSGPRQNRLLSSSRRALSLSALPEITLESVLNACNHEVPSLVCTMSTAALTHAMLSEFCGATSVITCMCDMPYLLGLA